MYKSLDVFFSTAPIDMILNRDLITEVKIYDIELYQLIIDAIHYNCRTGDSVENYLYYWIYAGDEVGNNWRSQMSNATANHIAEVIKEAKTLISINNPNILDLIENSCENRVVSTHNHFIILNG